MIKCPMCGLEFDREEALGACSGCMAASNCLRLKCPNCGAEFPGDPKYLALLRPQEETDEKESQ
jgi:predicted amidophosphoribosyltransferase